MVRDTQTKINRYVEEWQKRCYYNGIPDEAPISLKDHVPSWKKIAVCLLKNDLYLEGIGMKGFTSKYYHELKRIELLSRPQKNGQLKIPFNKLI